MLKDLLHGLRAMARTPGITAIAVLTLALGIGVNTAMFSVVNALLLRPLPYRDPGRLVTIRVQLPSHNIFTAFVDYYTYAELWKGQSQSFEAMSAFTYTPMNLSEGTEPERLAVCRANADIRQTALNEQPDLEMYMPHTQTAANAMALVVRTSMDPMRLALTIRAAVRELDKELPLSDISPLSESVSNSTRTRRFSVTLLGGFAALAVLLAAVGIYGVISYSVTRRTHEIGVRMALGAHRRRIVGMVVGQAVLLGVIGVAIGIAGSLALTRLLESMLYGVSATDPAIFAGVSMLLLSVAALAGYLPARRAARVDPNVALGCE